MTEQTPASASDIAAENNPAPATENAASATVPATGMDDHRIPKARLDEEIAKRRTVEGELEEIAKAMLAEVPENLKPLVPEGLSPAQQIKWFNSAKATGVFNSKAIVPATDSAKPKTTPQEADLSNLPVAARMAAGYGGK